MTDPPPTSLDDINNDDDELVALWWLRHDHLTRRDAYAAQALDWAHNAVRDRMWFDDTEGTVWLLDRLLEAPGADPAAAENLLDELLADRGPEVAPMIADLASRHPRWQTALKATSLDPAERAAVPELAPYIGA